MKVGPLFITGFLLAVYLISFASAAIQQSNIEIIISGSKALVTYNIQTDQSSVQLIVPDDAKINELSEKDYSLDNGMLTVQLTSKNLKLSYFTDSFIEKASKSYFTADFKTIDDEDVNVRLILPEFSAVENAFPAPIITSDGQHIILDWKSSLKANGGMPLFVIYKEKSGLSWLWIAGIAVVLAILIIFLLKRKPKIIRVKSKGKTKEKSREIESHLLESESAVIKTLKEAKGEMWQKQIQLKTGFSKAKLSRTIRNLEARGLVKRIPLGNTNKIKLK